MEFPHKITDRRTDDSSTNVNKYCHAEFSCLLSPLSFWRNVRNGLTACLNIPCFRKLSPIASASRKLSPFRKILKQVQDDVKLGNFFSRFPFSFSPRFGFTLAEVLIVVGIIGIVAEMTIPTLIQNTEKQVSLTKLKMFYSTMEQAITMSETDNGSTNTWIYPAEGDGSQTLIWFNTYLAPYFKYQSADIATDTKRITIKLNNGCDIQIFKGMTIVLIAFLNGYEKSTTIGKNIFFFELYPTAKTNAFRPYEWDTNGTDRTKWTTGSFACNLAGEKEYCAGLIQYEGWTIPSDYPYWN